jgi:endogenous inhibitor of DNA gyrase (YacG/DUF329 family)
MERIDMYKCPHCGKPGIPVWRKLCMGPIISANCKQCGREVGVPYSSILYILPFMAAMVLTIIYLDPIEIKVTVWVALTIIMLAVYLKFVPLVPK